MADGYASRHNQVAYPAADERRLLAPLLMPATGAFSARAGRRVDGAGLAVSVGGSPEGFTVSAGAGVIFSPEYATGGPWLFEIPTDVTRQLPARPGSGLTRIDLIVARIYDADSSVGATRETAIERIGGTPSASPSAPTAPALSLILATLTVPASGSITVTATTERAVAAGGVLPVATTSARNAMTPWRGLVVHNGQTSRLEVYDGSTWQTVTQADDSDWIDISMAPDYQSNNTPLFSAPSIRRVGGVLYFRGAISKTTGNFPASSVTTIATLGAGYRPNAARDFQCAGSTAATACKIRVGADGVVQIITGPSVPTYISLADVHYPLG